MKYNVAAPVPAFITPVSELTDEIWITEDGRHVPVGELDLEHLRNILRMLLRRRRERNQAQEITRKMRRGLKPNEEVK